MADLSIKAEGLRVIVLTDLPASNLLNTLILIDKH